MSGKTNPFLAGRRPACKSNCCILVRFAHHRYSYLPSRSSSCALEHCKDHAIMLDGLQHLTQHAQHAYTTYHCLRALSQLCLKLRTTPNLNGAQLPTCNLHTLLPAQITLCQPAAHLLLHTRRPAVKNSTSQVYHHVRLFGKHMHMSVMCL